MIQIEFLPASNGDSIFINIDNKKHILIDGGIARTYTRILKNRLKNLEQDSKSIDLVVITHIDNDHLVGILKLFGDKYRDLVKKVWFNSGTTLANYFENKDKIDKVGIKENQKESQEIGYKDAIKLEDKLYDLDIANRVPIKAMDAMYLDDIYFKILSPNSDRLYALSKGWNKVLEDELKKETSHEVASHKNDYDKTIEELVNSKIEVDTSIANGSSIAFLMQYQDFKFLFLADAFVDVIINSLKKFRYSKEKPLKVNFIKLSHHGSKKNINEELLELIDTDTYIISTNGNRHNHPNQEALSRIIMFNFHRNRESKFIFNYKKEKKLADLFQLYEFEISSDNKYDIYFNIKYKFYLYFPKNRKNGLTLEF